MIKKLNNKKVIAVGVLMVVLLGVIFSRRAFCKVLCPIGAILAPLNLLSFWKVKLPTDNCISCDKCDEVCPSIVSPSSRINQGIVSNRSLDCMVCHDCRTVCSQKAK